MTSNAEGPVLGIDIGGTKLAAGVVTTNGETLSFVTEVTPRTAGAEEIFQAVLAMAKQALAGTGQSPVKIGIGCGGPMQYPAGIVSPLHLPAWRDFPVRERLEKELGLPAVLDNDAKALALGEAMFGAGRGAKNLLGMVVSTGVGGGIVTEGKLYHGVTGNAGHIGHAIVAETGPRCECGAVGCVTAYASGSALMERAREALVEGEVSIMNMLPLDQITANIVSEAAAAGDPLGLRLMNQAGRALARGIASAASLFDLDRVVIGGGVTQAGDLLFAPLREELKRRARLNFTQNLEVFPAGLGLQAGVIGAAALALAN